MRNLPKLNNSYGITIIELLLVTSIMLILGLMSVSFYSRFLTQNAVDNTTNQLVQSFRKAQVYSMTGKQNEVWGVKYQANKIILYLTGNSAFDETFSVNSNITIDNFTDISFARITGIPSTSGAITISGNNSSKTVTVNSQGVVSKTD